MIKLEMVCENRLESIVYIVAVLTDKSNSVILYLDPEHAGFFEPGATYRVVIEREE